LHLEILEKFHICRENKRDNNSTINSQLTLM